jgi:glyoxylase-like metal-dependent hydrolase (beta-lactamase superfamily II)
MNPNIEHPFKRFQLGDLELTIVSDGHQIMQPAHPIFAPFTDPRIVKQLLIDNFRPTDFVDLSLHILLIRKDEKLIMIDSGLGHIDTTGGKLLRALAAAGFESENITDIIITHAHRDHIGGLTDRNGNLTFPNAQIYISRTEFDFWTADVHDFTKSPMKDDITSITGMVSGIKYILNLVDHRIRLIETGDVLFNCIRLTAAPGHTPGHIVVEIFSGGEQLMHIADIAHSDILLFPHPEWGFSFDTDFEQAVTTRRRIFDELEENNILALAYHLPWPGLGYVKQKATGFEWVPDANY